MTPEIAGQLADHGARIDNVEDLATRVEEKLDKLMLGVIGTLATAVLALAGVIVQLLKAVH